MLFGLTFLTLSNPRPNHKNYPSNSSYHYKNCKGTLTIGFLANISMEKTDNKTKKDFVHSIIRRLYVLLRQICISFFTQVINRVLDTFRSFCKWK